MTTRPASHPASRRRNAHLIATCAQLVADTARAAAAIYQPIANNPTGPVLVSGRDLYLLAAGARTRLDYARELDQKQWEPLTAAEEAGKGDATSQRIAVACLRLQESADAVMTDPSRAAELALAATGELVQMVHLASLDA